MPDITILNSHRCFSGSLHYCGHESDVLGCSMRFTTYLPDQSRGRLVPLLWWLSGLTCTEENFTIKAGAYAEASRLGIAIIAPDTGPRGEGVADDPAYDLGQGAGFYVDATERPWSAHFHMYSYVTRELQQEVTAEFPVDEGRQGISGHSMGGHGALVLGLRNPDIYRSISAFAPIVAPSQCPWGQKALTAYLGPNEAPWADYDACKLLESAGDRSGYPGILVDQGASDQFLEEQLKPELFEKAAQQSRQRLELRMQPGFDHSYFFVSSFIGDHLRHHMAILDGG